MYAEPRTPKHAELLQECFDRAVIDLNADAVWLFGEGVEAFADLHDLFDANELGIRSIEHDLPWQDDPLASRVWTLPAGEFIDFVNALQARIDAWLRAGHLKTAVAEALTRNS